MPTIDNVRVFPEGAGIRERGFGTQVTGRLDDGNSITFAELLKEWYCHITGNPKAVLPYLKNRKNPKKLDISNDDERRIFSDKWYISYASGFNKTVIPVEQLTHDAIHTMLGMPTSWIGEHHVHYAQPLIGLQIGCGIGGFPFGRKAIDWQIHKSESGFFKDIQIDKILKAWNSKSSENLKGSLSAYFSALMIGSVNINREQSICDSVRENYLLFCKSFDSKYLKKTVSSQWRYAGFLTSLHKINQPPSSKDEGLGIGLKAGAADAVPPCRTSSHTLNPSGVSS